MPESTGSTVFVVDDEPLIARTTAAILQRYGFDARFFSSPQDALLALEAGPTPAAVISDIFMPGLNGVDLAVHVKKLFPACIIILMSAHARLLDVLKPAREQGFDFLLLPKPVLPSDMVRELNKCLDSGDKVPRAAVPTNPETSSPSNAVTTLNRAS